MAKQMDKDSQNSAPFLLSKEYQILFSGADSDNFQRIAQTAAAELDASVMIADSLHYLLAVSDDLLRQYGQIPSWLDLIESGYAPPVAEDADSPLPIPHPSNLCENRIGDHLIIHDKLKTKSGRFCLMCDILDKNDLILKLAISSPEPLTDEKKKLILALSLSVQFAYHRLHIDHASDARGRYLLELLTDGGISEKGLFTYNGFDPAGSFELLYFHTDDLGQHNLSFLPLSSDISKMPQVLSVIDGGFCVLLVNKDYGYGDLYERLDNFSSKYGFPILISPDFQDLKSTPKHYQALKKAASLAGSFQGIEGLHKSSEFSLFLLFENLDPAASLHPDAEKLLAHDLEKQSQYALTLYAYLFHNCEAPASAQALYIHRNTLDNRLRKVESLLSGNLRDVSYQFLMLFSLYTLLKEKALLPYYPSLL